MKNTYLLVISDSDDPSYDVVRVMQHETRSELDLLRDYEVLLDIHAQNKEWCIDDVMHSLEKLGWKSIDIPEIKVSY